jgi:hypothetical protein
VIYLERAYISATGQRVLLQVYSGILVTAPMPTEAESFYDEIKKSDKCTFFEGSHKKLPVRT